MRCSRFDHICVESDARAATTAAGAEDDGGIRRPVHNMTWRDGNAALTQRDASHPQRAPKGAGFQLPSRSPGPRIGLAVTTSPAVRPFWSGFRAMRSEAKDVGIGKAVPLAHCENLDAARQDRSRTQTPLGCF
jgi:hypothetical protein